MDSVIYGIICGLGLILGYTWLMQVFSIKTFNNNNIQYLFVSHYYWIIFYMYYLLLIIFSIL